MIIVESLGRSECSEDVKHNYYYRLTKNEIKLNQEDDNVGVQAYGIEVERQDVSNGTLVGIERDSIRCISPHRHKVHILLKLMHDNMVSPIHLVDILGEYVDDNISDFDIYNNNIATI